MKRLAFWMIVGLVVVNLASRRESTARDEATRSDPGAKTTHVIVYNQNPAPGGEDQDDTTITITRGRVRTGRPVPPVPPPPPRPGKHAPRPPKPPKLSDVNRPTPAWFPKSREDEAAAAKTNGEGRRILVGPISASPTEALGSLRDKVRKATFDWLAPEIQNAWEPSASELDGLAVDLYVQPVLIDLDRIGVDSAMTFGAAGIAPNTDNLYTLYKAGEVVDFSEAARHRLVKHYQSRLVRERMIKGGGILAFALICLGALTGYIRADEATKGYYSHRLKVLAAAGVGAAGYGLYRWLA